MELAVLLDQPNALPSAPQALARLVKTFDNLNASTDDVVECIELEPVVVAKLLRLVNSPFFFRGRTIENTSDAVRLLGITQVRSVVIGLIARDRFPGLPPALLDAFWRFSLSAAELARELGRKVSAVDSDAAYTGALLHMIGALVMRMGMTEKMLALDRICPPLHLGRAQAESTALGYSFAEVGAELARRWELPERIVRTQREPRLEEGGLEAAMVMVASWRMRANEMRLAREALIGLCPLPVIKAIKFLGLSPAAVIDWAPAEGELALF